MASQKLGFFPLRQWITLRQTYQEFVTGAFVEQRAEEAVRSIDDVDSDGMAADNRRTNDRLICAIPLSTVYWA
jgi:hypothetical protein